MTEIVVSVDTPEKIMEPSPNENSTSTTSTSTTMRTAPRPTVPPLLRRISKGLADDGKETSHLNYIQNTAVDNENILAKAIKSFQCESQRSRFSTAMLTAQWNGWLEAKQLGYPNCSKLTPIGATAQLEVCSINFVEISAKETVVSLDVSLFSTRSESRWPCIPPCGVCIPAGLMSLLESAVRRL